MITRGYYVPVLAIHSNPDHFFNGNDWIKPQTLTQLEGCRIVDDPSYIKDTLRFIPPDMHKDCYVRYIEVSYTICI